MLPARLGEWYIAKAGTGDGTNVTLLDVVLVALISGLGEALPLGASAHLALLPAMAAAADQRAAVAAAADLGIACALSVYFWRDMAAMGLGLFRLAKGRSDSGARLFFQLLIGTLPAALLGSAFAHFAAHPGGRTMVAAAMLVFGLFLLVADRLGMTVRRIDHLGLAGTFAVGILQAAALIPGVARVGVAITAARLMGCERREAARLALLLSIPLLASSALSLVWSLRGHLVVSADLAGAAGIAFLAALAACAFMMAWVRRNSFAPFAVWRILLGGAMLIGIFWR